MERDGVRTRAHGLWERDSRSECWEWSLRQPRELMFLGPRRVRTCLSLSVNKIHPSLHEPTLSASFLPYELCYTGAENPGKEAGTPLPSCPSPSGSPFADVIQSLAGLHQEHHKALMDMRADQERRFCALVQNQREDRELFRSWMDREVRAGESPTALAPPTHMPVQRWGRRMTRRHSLTSLRRPGQHVGGPRRTGSAPHPPANRGGAVGGAAAASPEPPGLRRPKRAILQRVGRSPEQHRHGFRSLWAWGERPALRDGSPAPGRLPQMAVGREGGVDQIIDRVVLGAVYCAAPHEDRAVGPVPPSGVAGPGHPTRRGPDGGVPRGWRNPTVRLSLSPPLLFLPLPSCPGPVPAWFPEPSPDGGEARLRSRRPREPTPGRRGRPLLFPFPRSLHANSLSPFPPLGWRGSLGRPAGVAGTRATLSIVVRWWRWGHWSGFRTPRRPPPIRLAGTRYLWVLRGVHIGLWWIRAVTKPRSIKA